MADRGANSMRYERSVLHFNVADFAVAVEREADVALRSKPVVIASCRASRAVVYDMSEEAYGDGVRKGMLLRQATRFCPGAVVLTPRPYLYQQAMTAFGKTLEGYSPLIESGVGDGHFFVDVTGTHRLYGPAPDIGWRVRREVRRSLGIDPIWTLGTSKLISKVASRLVKPVGEYIVTPGEEAAFLAPLPTRLLPGLTAEELLKMEEFRLTTVRDLVTLSRSQLRVAFGGRGDFLYDASRGDDGSRVTTRDEAAGAVECAHTFGEDTNDREALSAVVAVLAGRAGFLLRGRNQVARRTGIWLCYSDGAHVVRQASCGKGTAEDRLLRELAATALQRAWIRRTRIRSCRLVCDRLQPRSPQLSLFPELDAKSRRQHGLQEAVDGLRSRYGHDIIGVGRQYTCPVGTVH
ncbi:DNA polymerase Y family protein [Desulforhopalus singaporensis]|uniref:DNA polymerase-4 n=1 Tax=Desulforhopalus singaporensis TaxID=91360 RepID=A0A1H0M419_9BACT|nr:hypothetical protein [Desulforhopalus singaporensis]SDO75051.1 DNA polymerase-4 [Desulforhopalus singaporensis]